MAVALCLKVLVLTPHHLPDQCSFTSNQESCEYIWLFPSREDLEGLTPRLDEQDLEVSFIKVLCLDPSLASAQTTSIPTCKK